MHHKTAIVIGAGIVGLAMTRSLSERGYSVTVFERNERAIGASIRNFGMLWPIGQPNGKLYERALQSKSIWKQVCREAGLWYEEKGSLHLAYNNLEQNVISEFVEVNKKTRPVSVLSAGEALQKSEAANPSGLQGALWSEDEMIIESRVAMEKLPVYLCEKYNVTFNFGIAITSIEYPSVSAGKKKWSADEIYVCSGSDFETLYADIFTENGFTKCKLQMMRLVAQPGSWRIGPSLCSGLSLIHYKGFEVASSLLQLKLYYQDVMPEYLKFGIHVMVCQNASGELTIGDSHEYALVHDPFNGQIINELIIDYLKQFALFKNWQLLQSWNGIYPKMPQGNTDFIYQPEQGVTIVNGLGGAGMTLSFGLAEEVVSGVFN
jgi:FAD dependent oxidoreductase TIGR03364